MSNLVAVAADVRERRFVEHTLQLAIQAALDVDGDIGWGHARRTFRVALQFLVPYDSVVCATPVRWRTES
jgi:hypothetical protein